MSTYLYVDAGLVMFSDPKRTYDNESPFPFPREWHDFVNQVIASTPNPEYGERLEEYLDYAFGNHDKINDPEVKAKRAELAETLGRTPQIFQKHVFTPLGEEAGIVATDTGYGDGGYELVVERNADGIVTKMLIDFIPMLTEDSEDYMDGDKVDNPETFYLAEREVGTVIVDSGALVVGDPCYVYAEHDDKTRKYDSSDDILTDAKGKDIAELWGRGLGVMVSGVPVGEFAVKVLPYAEDADDDRNWQRTAAISIDFTTPKEK